MKKNIRFVSAAAAALLAVAPVVASAVPVNADVVAGGSVVNNGVKPGDTSDQTLTFSSSLNTVNYNQSVSDLTSDANIKKILSVKSGVSTDNAQIAAVSRAYVTATNNEKDNQAITSLNDYVGKTVYIQVEVSVSGLSKSNKSTDATNGKDYSYTSSNARFTDGNTTNNQGVITNIQVAIPVTVINSSIPGQPYFANSNNQAYANGQTIPATTTDSKGNVTTKVSVKNTTDVANIIKNMKLDSYLTSANTNGKEDVSITADKVASELKDQKITVNNDGTFTTPNGGFTLTFTRTNPENGKTATLNVFFKGQGNYATYPLIKFGDTKVKEGEETFDQQPIATVDLGNKDWATAVLKQFSAEQSLNNPSALKLTTQNLSSSDINVNQSGLYNATLTATNSNGLTTTLNFRVAVVGSEKDAVENKTVTGSTNQVVKLVSIVDGKVSDLQGKVANQGQSIAVYPNDTTTVDGVSYTRVYTEGTKRSQNNVWIPTENVTEVTKTQKTVMHKAYVYNKDHKRVGTKSVASFEEVTVLGDKTKLSDGTEAYKIGDNEYVVAGNIDGTKRTLKHNAYVYATSKKRATKEVLKKGDTVTTYGSAYTFKNGKKYYRIEGATASNKRYVKVANFK